MNTQKFRVYLRAFEPDDYKVTIKWHRDDQIWSMVAGPKYFVSAEYEKKWIENAIWDKNQIKLGVCLNDTDQLIGMETLKDIDWISSSGQSACLIGEKEYWGKGYGVEAGLLLLEFAFRERDFNRVWAKILENNIGSIKLHERCGYKQEGILRQSVYKNGEFRDQVIMSILREEFESLVREQGLE